MQGKLASFLNFINLLDTKVGKDLRTLTFDISILVTGLWFMIIVTS